MRHADTTLPFVQGLGFVVDWEHRFEAGLPLFAQLTLRWPDDLPHRAQR